MISLIFERGLEEFQNNLKNLTTQNWPKNAVLKGFYQKSIFCPGSPRLRYVFYESSHENKCVKIEKGGSKNHRFPHRLKMKMAPITSQVTQKQLKYVPIDSKWSRTLEKVLKLSFLAMLRSKNYRFHRSK